MYFVAVVLLEAVCGCFNRKQPVAPNVNRAIVKIDAPSLGCCGFGNRFSM